MLAVQDQSSRQLRFEREPDASRVKRHCVSNRCDLVFGHFKKMKANQCEPGKRIGHVSVCYEGKLIVWGGYNDEFQHRYLPPDQVWVYDTLTENWSAKKCIERLLPVKDMPPGTSGASACLVDHHMYIFGGYTDEGNTSNLYRVNLAPLNYDSDLSTKRPMSPQITFERLRPENDIDCAPTACDKNTSWAFEGKVYMFGGYGLEPAFNSRRHLPADFYFLRDQSSHWHYQRGWNNQLVCYDAATNEWSFPKYKGRAPCPRAAHALAQLGSKVYIFGGRSGKDRLDDLWCLDMVTMTWTCLNDVLNSQVTVESSSSNEVRRPRPVGRSWHSLTAISESEIVLYGGLSNGCDPLKDCWTFNVNSSTWTPICLPSEPRLWHTAVFSPLDDEVLIYGGGTQNILNYRLSNVYTNDLITLRFSPKSLLRLAMDSSVQFTKQLSAGFKEIPVHLRRLLEERNSTRMDNVELAGS